MKKLLIMVSPHNWYDHVKKNKINRPKKFLDEFAKKKYFDSTVLVNRLHPKRILNKSTDERRLLKQGLFYRLLLDEHQCIFYFEHCLPFGQIEKLLLPILLESNLSEFSGYKRYLWICDPKSAYLFQKVNAFKIFDAYDDWSLSPLYEKKKKHLKFIKKGYLIACEKSDIIFVNTNIIRNKFNKHNHLHIVPNSSSIYTKKDELLDGENCIGYIGNIHERIDLDILESTLRKFEDFQVIFIGDNHLNTKRFTNIQNKYGNLKLLGPVEYNRIPSIAKKFRVCIVPHLVNKYTLSQDSMKIYDNLALGNAIVTTSIPPADSLPKLKGFIYEANSPEDFIMKINDALHEDGDLLINRRIEYMNSNRWIDRVELIYEKIQEVEK